MERIYYVTDSILRLVYINLLAILFSLAGLIIFGFFPSLVATCHLMRKWHMGESDLPVTKTFIKIYRRSFLKSNLIGLAYVLIGGLLYINLSIAEIVPNEFVQLSYYPIFTVLIVFLSCSLLAIPISLHYQVTFYSLIKHSFLLLFVRPLLTLMLLGSVAGYVLLLKLIPGLFLFIGISLFAWLILYYSLKIFHKVPLNIEAESL
ncbi:DUF624 domain-containing protein [Gracilibacillus oryzae]|uniref:DUF624 domain-containing protein n=1 Tax=Gracilibacillus oryzae TaxID=1672701 RepID=A0A7C8GR83_9BACI|nr:DUF624 domain-containing protein [Gracilibacillus oryzae]KAB8127835.1 DUF624 domain-containing protein [Gracilibacillus oryzae]